VASVSQHNPPMEPGITIAKTLAEKKTIPEIVSETVIPGSTETPKPELQDTSPVRQPLIELASAAEAENETLVDALVDIVNAVYGETEGNIFVDGYQRTNAEDMRKFIRAGEIGVAYLPISSPEQTTAATQQRQAIGCIRIQQLSSTHGEFGMMALDARYRGGGFGREMVRFAEEHCRGIGLSIMQLELLVPQDFEHAFKKRLQEWYMRMGYTLIKLGRFKEDYPQLAALLKGSCEYRVFEKPLL
jgi:GNAT superfamily N-acetyltransferase